MSYATRLLDPEAAVEIAVSVDLALNSFLTLHLGMLDVDSYARSWRRKRAWYVRNGFIGRLITSADAPGGGLSVPEVKARAERRMLRRESRRGEPGFDTSSA